MDTTEVERVREDMGIGEHAKVAAPICFLKR